MEQHLANYPDNVDLLYFRAMTAAEQFDRLDILEADLRRIIEMDPTNADALNALQYRLGCVDRSSPHASSLVVFASQSDAELRIPVLWTRVSEASGHRGCTKAARR